MAIDSSIRPRNTGGAAIPATPILFQTLLQVSLDFEPPAYLPFFFSFSSASRYFSIRSQTLRFSMNVSKTS